MLGLSFTLLVEVWLYYTNFSHLMSLLLVFSFGLTSQVAKLELMSSTLVLSHLLKYLYMSHLPGELLISFNLTCNLFLGLDWGGQNLVARGPGLVEGPLPRDQWSSSGSD